MKKLQILLIILTFTAPWFTPIAGASGAPGEEIRNDGEVHFCELSGGECTHGEACPLKERHQHKKKTAGHADRGVHDKTKKRVSVIASECHGDDGIALNIVGPPFITSGSLEPRLPEVSTTPFINRAIPVSKIEDSLPFRPPKNA